jgi:hypothetical protein
MTKRIADLTTLDAFLMAGVAIAISEGLASLTPSTMSVMLAFCLLSIFISLKMCWPLRAKAWFMPYFLIATAAHIPLLLFFGKFNMQGFYLVMTPLVGLDVFVIVAVALKIDDRGRKY